jgi:hypothetical protein
MTAFLNAQNSLLSNIIPGAFGGGRQSVNEGDQFF